MDSVISRFEQVMMPLANRISGNRYLLAMRDAFSMLLPFIIVGSFFGIIEWVVLDPWGTIMGEDGLNLGQALTGLSGEAYKASGFVAVMQMLQGLCNNVVTVGFGIFSFLLVAAFSYRLGGIWGGDNAADPSRGERTLYGHRSCKGSSEDGRCQRRPGKDQGGRAGDRRSP